MMHTVMAPTGRMFSWVSLPCGTLCSAARDHFISNWAFIKAEESWGKAGSPLGRSFLYIQASPGKRANPGVAQAK